MESAQSPDNLGIAQTVPDLIERLLNSPDLWARIDAAQALGRIGDARAVPGLLVALKSEQLIEQCKLDWEQAKSIADRDAQASRRAFLWETLTAEISDIRVAAARALGQIGGQDARAGLSEALQEKLDPHVRQAAAEALERLDAARADSSNRRKAKGDDRRMLARAQRLVEKYTQPNPPGMGPSPKTDEGILEVWAWATSAGRADILSGLAQTACRLLRSAQDRRAMQSQLRQLAAQAQAEQRWKAHADLLMALAKLEGDLGHSPEEAAVVEANRLALYEQALAIYTRLDDWAGEATCASLMAAIYRHWRRFDQVRRLSLRSYVLWAAAGHRKGIADALFGLSDLLESEGRYVEACRLMYCAKKLVAHSIWAISARDSLKRMAYERRVSPGQYESKRPAEALAQELVAEIFGVTL